MTAEEIERADASVPPCDHRGAVARDQNGREVCLGCGSVIRERWS